MSSIPNDHDVKANLWSELEDLPKQEIPAKEGPINMGMLNLTSNKDISKIANTYKAAFDAKLNCVPYFTITE